MTSAATPRRTVRYIRRAFEFMDKIRELINLGYEITQCNMPKITLNEDGEEVETHKLTIEVRQRRKAKQE